MPIITRLEEAILIAIMRLEDNAYGVTINKQVSRSSKRDYSMGALYFALDRLLQKQYVSKRIKPFYNKKGGRSRTYYTLTENGNKALREVRDYHKSLWEGIPEIMFEAKNTK
jgi:PadR family transcriptional regulator PadR